MTTDAGESGASGKVPGPPRSLFLALEGGGAKGIAHVAALRALEKVLENARANKRDEYVIREVAGTSAGAIVAAFIAAGATSRELIDDAGRMPLAGALGIEKFHDLFGLAGWRRLKLWRRILKPTGLMRRVESRISGTARRSYLQWRETKPAKRIELSPASRAEVRKHRRRVYVAPLVTLILILVGLLCVIIIGWALDFIGQHSDISALAFVTFWVVARIFIALSNYLTRRWEQHALKNKSRHAPIFIVALTHPATSILFAFGITSVLYYVGFIQGTIIHLKAALSPWWKDVLAYTVYGLCPLLLLRTAVAYVREFLKGVVRTDRLGDDLNAALIKILTHAPHLDRTGLSYIWKPKDSTEQIEALSKKIAENPDYKVTFADLENATGRKLNVVAADTVGTVMLVYSSVTHGNYSVSAAVAASLAIPFVFRPLRTTSKLLVDGGIVSSIPAWIFRRHRTHDPDSRILAIGIAPIQSEKWIPIFLRARRMRIANYEGRPRRRHHRHRRLFAQFRFIFMEPLASLVWPLRFLANVAYTSAYGARALELEASDRLDSFELPTGFHLLDFDKTQDEVRLELDALTGKAEILIEQKLWKHQEAFEMVCQKIEADLWARYSPGDTENSCGDRSKRIRILWADREPRVDSIRIKRVFNFEPDELGDRMILPFDSSVAGWSAATGSCYFADNEILGHMLDGPKNRYRRMVRWEELEWCWTIPIRTSNKSQEIAGVLVVQCNRPFEMFGSELSKEGALRKAQWKYDMGTEELRRVTGTGAMWRPYPITPGLTIRMETLEQVWIQSVRGSLFPTKDSSV
jgi:predicted acylesterase/phospholipase RssA